MSKMPAKKKSCFQITSVTPAQVAGNSITDDTESLDDPDESRTEDVSSEIFDVSRAEFELEVCNRSSSEETLNNVVDTEAPGAVAPHIPQDGQLPSVSTPPNGGFSYRSTVLGSASHVSQQAPEPVGPAGQPPSFLTGIVQQSASVAAVVATSVSLCTSQLPSATNLVSTATATTTTSCSSRFRVIKLDHGTGEPFRRGRWTCMEYYERDSEGSVMTRTVDSIRHGNTLDHSTDRDSGLGATAGSVTGQGPDSTADAHLQAAEPYAAGQQPAGIAMTQGAFQPPGYSTGSTQIAPQTLLSAGPFAGTQGVPTLAQPFGYPAQGPLHLLGHPTSQADYRQLQTPGAPTAAPQTLPGVTGSGQPLDSVSLGQPAPAQGPLQQPGVGTSSLAQYQPSGPTGGSPVSSSTPVNVPNLTPCSAAQPQMMGGSASPGEDGHGQSDVLPQPPVTPGKDPMKPLVPENLQLHSPSVNSLFGISIPLDGDEDGASGASVVAIDNKIEQAMDLVKSHLMYAVREEVEVLKEQIKELYEKNSMLERENAVLKSLANSDQLSQLSQGSPQPVTPQPNISSV